MAFPGHGGRSFHQRAPDAEATVPASHVEVDHEEEASAGVGVVPVVVEEVAHRLAIDLRHETLEGGSGSEPVAPGSPPR